jgi:hypothetical protein
MDLASGDAFIRVASDASPEGSDSEEASFGSVDSLDSSSDFGFVDSSSDFGFVDSSSDF